MDHQGGGKALLPYFSSSVSYQRGRGFGSVIRSIFRGIVPLIRKPIVKQGFKTLGKAAATALLEAGQQAIDEKDMTFGSALKSASKTQAQALLKEARSRLVGQGRRGTRRSMKTRKMKTKRAPISRKRKVSKKRRVRSRDIFTK